MGYECGDVDKAKQVEFKLSVAYSSLVFGVLLPFGTWFARKFWSELNEQPLDAISKLTRLALKVFIVATTAMLWTGAYYMLVFPLLKAGGALALWHCAVVGCTMRLAYICAYTCYQRILLERLKVVFADSTHPVSARITSVFDAIQYAYLLCAAAIVYLWSNPCFAHVRFYELPNENFHDCITKTPVSFALLLYIAFLICGNLVLVWMYLWRLKAVFIEANYSQETADASSERGSMHVMLALDLMRKSTVVAIWSVASSLLVVATFWIPFRNLGIVIDPILNEVLIYCLFTPDGDDLYDKLFGFCHFTVECCLPKRALEIEYDLELELRARMNSSHI